jgi:hypothetical protein
MRLFILLIINICFFAQQYVIAQDSTLINRDSTALKKTKKYFRSAAPDSASLSRQRISDSLALINISRPDPHRENQFIKQILDSIQNRKYIFFNDLSVKIQPGDHRQIGQQREGRDPLILIILIGLLVYSAFVGRILGKEIIEIVHSVYSKRALLQVSREDKFLNPWSFLSMFCLFGFTFGLFLYQLADYYESYYTLKGFRLFIFFSVVVLGLFLLKIFILRILGFVFSIQKLVNSYISVIYLAYFNIAFILLAVVVCMSMISLRYVPILLLISTGLIALVFIFQYLRSSINVISSFNLHKVYLIIYLCALEICPILILIKALKL